MFILYLFFFDTPNYLTTFLYIIFLIVIGDVVVVIVAIRYDTLIKNVYQVEIYIFLAL